MFLARVGVGMVLTDMAEEAWLVGYIASEYTWRPIIYSLLYMCFKCVSFESFRREALRIWKQRLGCKATYRQLLDVFERCEFTECADTIRSICCESN